MALFGLIPDKETISTTQSTQLDPQHAARLMEALNSFQSNQARSNSLLGGYANQMNGNYTTDFTPYIPKLNMNYQGYVNQQGPDAMSQGLMAQGAQQINSQANRQVSDISRQFQNNPALAGIMKNQVRSRARLNANPLLFQAMAEQRARRMQDFGIENSLIASQAQEGQKAQLLRNEGLNSYNNYLLQQAGLANAPTQNSATLLNALAQLSPLYSTSTSTQVKNG